MEIKKKELYQIPLTEALEIKSEDVICLSGEIPATIDELPWVEETL